MHNSIKPAVIIHEYTFLLLGFEQNDLLIFITLQCQKNKMFVTYILYIYEETFRELCDLHRPRKNEQALFRQTATFKSFNLKATVPELTHILRGFI